MSVIPGAIAGLAGGLIGATAWALITLVTGYEIGWIAWGVGGLVGFGVMWGSQGNSKLMGGIAVAITILAILAGKYAAVRFSIVKELGSKSQAIQRSINDLENDEYVISFLADEIVTDRLAGGQEVKWPAGVSPDEAATEAEYPDDIWAQASADWDQMTDADKQTYRGELSVWIKADIEEFYAEIYAIAYRESFAVMDLVFFGLAVVTAFRIAASQPQGSQPPDPGDDGERDDSGLVISQR